MTNLHRQGEQLPLYIAVEGPIGVGKTTLTKKLAHKFNYDILLERAEDNPFLERFYADEANSALPTQLFFLFQRIQQLNSMRQSDIFQPVRVADFIIEKDPLFAQATLDENEFKLYQQVYTHAIKNINDIPKPDIVIYLQASVSTLLRRIKKRGIECEKNMSDEYLQHLNDAYARFFHFYQDTPLLIVNADDIDWVNNEDDFENLVNYMLKIKRGRHYYNPKPKLIS